SRSTTTTPTTSTSYFFLPSSISPPSLHSFPTRRSSDLLHVNRLPRRIEVARQHHMRGREVPNSFWVFDYPDSLIIICYKDGSLRSEEHTSELQSRFDLVCRLLLEKKKRATSTRWLFVTS